MNGFVDPCDPLSFFYIDPSSPYSGSDGNRMLARFPWQHIYQQTPVCGLDSRPRKSVFAKDKATLPHEACSDKDSIRNGKNFLNSLANGA